LIQWPYVQSPDGGNSTRIPPGLAAQCRLVKGRKDGLFADDDPGWVWDPFSERVSGDSLRPASIPAVKLLNRRC
jgi:hypothetical protein